MDMYLEMWRLLTAPDALVFLGSVMITEGVVLGYIAWRER